MREGFMFDVLITDGRIVDGTGTPWYHADVGVTAGKIAAVGRLAHAEAHTRLSAAGKVVAPGFIDTHVHGDLTLLSDSYHEPAIRQGVTTYLLGQDGVAMAPASPTTLDYMRRYTAGFSGIHDLPHRWESVAEYLALFDNRCALNVACLVPNGNVRMEVMGLEDRPATTDELRRMARLVQEGMEQGALGLSSGLDYIPSRYADTEELSALCQAIAPFGGVYVTHMRRYDPEGVLGSMDEVFHVGQEANVAVHISHFNSRAELALSKLDAGRAQGIDVTYDLYCYLAGSTILGMVVLPPWAQQGGIDSTLARLRDPQVRAGLREAFTQTRAPLGSVRLAFVAAERYRHLEGMNLQEAAEVEGLPVEEFVCDLLVESGMVVGCVVPHRNRDQHDVVDLIRHPAMMAGSDGIFTGSHPHPRGYGCFARYLGHHVRGDHAWTLEQAVQHLAGFAALKYGLKDRGFLRPGMAADVVVFDPELIADHSTYEDGKRPATGMEHVLVNGQAVLQDGKRTTRLPGRALRRG
jgi:N-acyl-D-amino-acid deacylase